MVHGTLLMRVVGWNRSTNVDASTGSIQITFWNDRNCRSSGSQKYKKRASCKDSLKIMHLDVIYW